MPLGIHPQSLLRAEPQAALWFQRQSAETLELDTEGLLTLQKILQGRRWLGLRGWLFRNYLLARGFVQPVPEADRNSQQQLADLIRLSAHTQAPLRARSAPEVLHISLTDACQQRCAGCFFSNQTRQPNQYFDFEAFQALTAQAVKARVFQLALGGGEPLMHPRLLEMVSHAHRSGLVVNLTSNGGLLTPLKARQLLQAGLSQIQFSLAGADAASHGQVRPGFEALAPAMNACREAGLRWGMNVLVTAQNLSELDAMLAWLSAQGVYSVNIIRPKPSTLEPDWLAQNLPDAMQNRQLAGVLQRWQRKGRFLLLTDTSLSFLRRADAGRLYRNGVAGCSAGRRMLSVQVDGRVSPCSHIPLSDTIEAGDFMQAWWASEHLERFRRLEETLQGACGDCELKSVCRGCRAVVWQQTGNFDGEDLQCPKRLSTFYSPS